MESNERKNQHTQSKLVHKTKAVDENVKLMEAIHDLRLATIRGDLQAVKDALDKGLTVNQPLKGGWTALMYACSLGHPLIVEFLLQQGANPNFHKELFTPLMATCASTQEHEDRLVQCVDLLLRYKANVNITERHHISALMFAAKEGHAKIVAQLLGENCNCEIDAQDSQGWTALFWAVNKGRANVVEILVRKGAKVDILDRRSHTAIDLAQNKRLDQIVEILKRKQPIIEYSQSEQVNYDSSGFKQKYEFEKNADSMLQVILEELSATAVNNNGRCGNRYKTLFNGMEFENNLELLKPHEEMILKVASSLNGCFQNSLLTNKFPKNSKYKYKSVETSWKNIPYSWKAVTK
ncbi:ankyrin repeat, SAM and basic leucine zipper domain-containing protein 1-like isoform X2 [Homalodisca vitripennis]|uniref:ankyrin repeat, SAM and basic leucine zipper domain-containing protein 1-like isoform X2 n=1 Tax=Homalodisca vitripennis TaxID=197043 RepID=UPI001EE9FBC7|nr:ankyrin repeat, SAM and basic leucine zipper domain-containing protein 1-like isoform X2 [Homalodisca vitripennis]